MLCAAGKVKKLVYGFATLDAIPLEPWYRKARENGSLELMEVDEGMFEWGLRAAGMRLPFLPTRCGLATDIPVLSPEIKTIQSPYNDGEVLLAMPALKLDVALVHVNVADQLGNTLIHGADPYFDHLVARAADACYVSAERVEPLLRLTAQEARHNTFERYLVKGVVHAPCGAHPTTCAPEYGWDMGHFKRYVASAADEGGWAAYVEEFVAPGEQVYQERNGGVERMSALPLPVF
jgi:glutaconate CoA-transferase subunit A